jgi:hypothetical protein
MNVLSEGQRGKNLPRDDGWTMLARTVLCKLLLGGECFVSSGGESSQASRDRDQSMLRDDVVNKRP